MTSLLTTISAEFTPLTQTNFLKAGVKDAIQPENVWRAQASGDMEVYPSKIGVPEIITVRGLRAPNTTPNNSSNLSDPNAGISFSGITYEQFQIKVDRFDGGDFVDMFARHLPIADKFYENYITLAQGAASSQDFVARNKGYDTYTSMQTFVTANTTASASIPVDDIRGFQPQTGAQGEVYTANVVVGANTYVLQSAVANTSVGTSSFAIDDGTLKGVAGTLTFTTTVATNDLFAGTVVKAVGAPVVFRANARTATSKLVAGDTLTMALVQKVKNSLTNNRLKNPTLLASPDALYGLYRDPEFQALYRGAYGSTTYQTGETAKLLGVNIVEITSAPKQTINGVAVHFAIMVTDGWLTEAHMTDTMVQEVLDGPTHATVTDNIAIITTAPTDPAGQFVKQVYLSFAGYACRTDRGLTSLVVPTASNAIYKRAAVIEVTDH
jgi:hypothetical protein